MSDEELERLKARRLEEMRRNAEQRGGPERAGPRDVIASRLGFRGDEVLRNAESQFPAQTAALLPRLAELMESGEIPGRLDGGQLLALLRAVGIPVRMDTKIKVEQDGKMVSLGEKLSDDGP